MSQSPRPIGGQKAKPFHPPPPELADPNNIPAFLTAKRSGDKAALWAIQQASRSPAALVALFRGAPSNFHLELQAHLLCNPEAGAEVPRGHGKTTLGCFTLAFLAGNDIDLRCKIVGADMGEATKTTVAIREIVTTQLYQAIFPRARVKVGDNAKDAFSFANRKVVGLRDPTFEARPVVGNTGGRFDILWGDDLCTLANTILKPAERAKVKAAWEGTWLPMNDYGAGGNERKRLWQTWTPWHVDDVSVSWAKHHAERGTLFRRAVQRVDGRWVSPWPEMFTHEILAKEFTKQGDLAFSRAYLLQRLSNDMLVFRHEWLLQRLYHGRCGDGVTTTVAALDFAYTKQGTMKPDRDWSVCLIGEVDRNRNLYLTDLLRVRTDYPTFKRMAIDLMVSRRVKHAYGEANGPQAGIVQQFQLDSPVPVVPLDRMENPIVRAVASQPFVAAGKLHLPAEPGRPTEVRQDMQPLFDEAVSFPVGAHDDTVSALCDLCEAATRGLVVSGGGPGILRVDHPAVQPQTNDGWDGF